MASRITLNLGGMPTLMVAIHVSVLAVQLRAFLATMLALKRAL